MLSQNLENGVTVFSYCYNFMVNKMLYKFVFELCFCKVFRIYTHFITVFYNVFMF